MTRTFLHTMSALVGFAFVYVVVTNPAVAQTDVLVVDETSAVLVLAATQTGKTCISELRARSGRPHFSDVLISSIQISGHGSPVVLEHELSVPAGEFRCVDIPYAELVAAGFDLDPRTGAITFRVDISPRGRTGTAGPNSGPDGAIMITDTATGEIETYSRILRGEFRARISRDE